MRPKVALIILLAGAAGLAGLLFLKKMMAARPQITPVPIAQSTVPPPATSPAIPQISPVINISLATNYVAPAAPVAIVPRITADTNMVAAPDADYVQKKIDRLQELQVNDDDASLKEILAELTNPNPTIRHEAIEATIQFGGHTAVPVLRDLAARTSDPDEKKELQDAADFLELPSLTEIRAQNPNVKIAPPPPAPVQP
jgi:hypothetical protein